MWKSCSWNTSLYLLPVCITFFSSANLPTEWHSCAVCVATAVVAAWRARFRTGSSVVRSVAVEVPSPASSCCAVRSWRAGRSAALPPSVALSWDGVECWKSSSDFFQSKQWMTILPVFVLALMQNKLHIPIIYLTSYVSWGLVNRLKWYLYTSVYKERRHLYCLVFPIWSPCLYSSPSFIMKCVGFRQLKDSLQRKYHLKLILVHACQTCSSSVYTYLQK